LLSLTWPFSFSLTFHFSSLSCSLLSYLIFTHSWSWALLEKPPAVQPLKKFPAFYGTRRFITVFTRTLHWSLSWDRSFYLLWLRSFIQGISPGPRLLVSFRNKLIFFTVRSY
jgi:hypothetical protein